MVWNFKKKFQPLKIAERVIAALHNREAIKQD